MSVIRQKIKNQVTIACDDVDFTTSTNIEVYVKQGSLFFQYTPTVVDAHHMTVDVPLADIHLPRRRVLSDRSRADA